VIPVGVNAVSGSILEFSAETANLPVGAMVYLEDNNTNTFTRIDSGTYNVTALSDLSGVGQFYIHTISSLLALSTTLENVSVYMSNNETLKIEGIEDGDLQVRMYNILGKQMLSASLDANGNNSIVLPSLPTGVYLVEIQNASNVLSKKIIIEQKF
tara:strand:+ start:107 stop:574 length:468 start_codon:yes stop_codon:yes gene_type:complete